MPQIRYTNLADLKPWPGAARSHSKAQIKQIIASIRRFGFTNPIIIDEDRQILAGQARVAAARAMGLEEVPAIRIDTMSEADKRAYMIADNKLTLNAGWDRKILGDELEKLLAEDLNFDIGITGFSTAEAVRLIDEPVEKTQPIVSPEH